MIEFNLPSWVITGGRIFRKYLRKLSSRSSTFELLADRIWNSTEILVYFSSILHSNFINSTEVAPTCPTLILTIDPQDILHVSPGEFHFLLNAGSIEGGDWDRQSKIKFRERYIYQSIKSHFIHGTPWEETEFYNLNIEKIRNGEKTKWESVESLRRKCVDFDTIYEDIQKNGYRSQQELVKQGRTGGIGDGGKSIFPGAIGGTRHEICVDIARDGEILLNEGRHRLSIASLLDVEEIPIRVVVRHRKWQDIRNDVAEFIDKTDHESPIVIKKEIQDQILNEVDRPVYLGVEHPDLQNLLPE